MLKKTCVTGGLLIAVAAGTLATSSAALAQPMGGGWGHYKSKFRFFSGHRNWNGNENESLNRIRLRIRNRNNNVAVARNEQAQRQRRFDRFPENEEQH